MFDPMSIQNLDRVIEVHLYSLHGWWFGSFLFFHRLGIILPIDEHMFFRGVEFYHQPVTIQCKINPFGRGSLRLRFLSVIFAILGQVGRQNGAIKQRRQQIRLTSIGMGQRNLSRYGLGCENMVIFPKEEKNHEHMCHMRISCHVNRFESSKPFSSRLQRQPQYQ